MTLVEAFVRTAKKHGDKLAIIDRMTGHRVTFKNALLRSLILSRKIDEYDPGFIGVMIPNLSSNAARKDARVVGPFP